GLEYYHSLGISHQDLSGTNCRCSYGGDILPPRGTPFYKPHHIRFGFIDFSSSTYASGGSGAEKTSRRVLGRSATRPYDAPELSDDVPYDPFAVDVYACGAWLTEMLRSYQHVSPIPNLVRFIFPGFLKFLRRLISAQPELRPTANRVRSAGRATPGACGDSRSFG
ncbi:hypothetical protein DACRYDRAFT_25662, partial [Dacryopinax primogenitus]